MHSCIYAGQHEAQISRCVYNMHPIFTAPVKEMPIVGLLHSVYTIITRLLTVQLSQVPQSWSLWLMARKMAVVPSTGRLSNYH